MKKKLIISIVFLTFAVSGCSNLGFNVTKLEPSASQVQVSNDEPEKDCKYLDKVVGSQNGYDGFRDLGFNSNKEMEQGAMNELRNQAAKLGANYVQLSDSKTTKQSINYFYRAQDGVKLSGKAFKCPQ